MNITDRIPLELKRKLDKVMSMDLGQLNDAYIAKMDAMGTPIRSLNQPPLDEIYRVLVPELFDAAEEFKKRNAN